MSGSNLIELVFLQQADTSARSLQGKIVYFLTQDMHLELDLSYFFTLSLGVNTVAVGRLL
uniref:Uncharacterized protein n=1 Tax=Anguilla anguilla TaxID=7936 RepID=A0A0E9UFK0_ANGAN